MSKYARYVSFSDGELARRLEEIGASASVASTLALTMRGGGDANGSGSTGSRGGGKLIKSHSCPVVFPDGRTGRCHYTRCGPAWHLFGYEYQSGARLPTQHETQRIGNDLASIEQVAKDKATTAYSDAVRREQKEYFQRSSECGSRRARSACFQMKAGRAKQLAGRYALCHRLGPRLIPKGGTYATLDEANAAWQEQGSSPALVVACCNRLDRCWEAPRFNPLSPAPLPEPFPRRTEVTSTVIPQALTPQASPLPPTPPVPLNTAPEEAEADEEPEWDETWAESDEDDPEWDEMPPGGEEGDDGC